MIDCGCIKFLSVELRVSVRLLQHLHSNWILYFITVLSLESLGSVVSEPTYLSCVFATSFNSIDFEMATIVDRACGDHPKLFVS